MFSKDSKAPTTTASTNGSAEESGKTGGVPSIISPDLKIVGNLKSNGAIQIDGAIEGDIKAHMLTIGEQAKVEGALLADRVRIAGSVAGLVQAKTVHLDKSAKVTADITHETMTMEAGASFEGQVKRLNGARPSTKVSRLKQPADGEQSATTESAATQTQAL